MNEQNKQTTNKTNQSMKIGRHKNKKASLISVKIIEASKQMHQ